MEGSLLLARHKVAYPLFRSRRGGAYLAKYFHKECVLCRIYFRSLHYVRRFTTRRTSSKLIFSRSKCWRERAPPWPGNSDCPAATFPNASKNLLTSHANGTNCYVHIKRERFEKIFRGDKDRHFFFFFFFRRLKGVSCTMRYAAPHRGLY